MDVIFDIPLSVLLQKTNVSHRQIDYWCIKGIIPYRQPHPGSGYKRLYASEYIPRINLLGKVSDTYGLPITTLKGIFDNYDEGYYMLAEDVYLVWTV